MVKICPVCRQSFPSKVALAQHMASHQGTVRGRRARGRQTGANVTTLAQEEYWGTTDGKTVTIFTFHPGSSKLPRLDTMASVFEQYRVTSIMVRFTPLVGSNQSGQFVAGWLRDPARAPKDLTGVAGLSPHTSCSVWQSGSLNIRAGDLMRQNWYYTQSTDAAETTAGAVAAVCSTNQSMSVWCRYVVQFSGPISRTDNDYLLRFDGKSWWNDTGEPVTQIPAADGPYSVDLEVTAGQSYLDQAWQHLQSLFSGAREAHRLVSDALSFGRWIADLTGGSLPTLPVRAATLHVHPDPFRLRTRYHTAEWRGPGAQGGNC